MAKTKESSPKKTTSRARGALAALACQHAPAYGFRLSARRLWLRQAPCQEVVSGRRPERRTLPPPAAVRLTLQSEAPNGKKLKAMPKRPKPLLKARALGPSVLTSRRRRRADKRGEAERADYSPSITRSPGATRAFGGLRFTPERSSPAPLRYTRGSWTSGPGSEAEVCQVTPCQVKVRRAGGSCRCRARPGLRAGQGPREGGHRASLSE